LKGQQLAFNYLKPVALFFRETQQVMRQISFVAE